MCLTEWRLASDTVSVDAEKKKRYAIGKGGEQSERFA
jgi:hypothetical protein